MATLIDTSLWIDFTRTRSPQSIKRFIAPYILHLDAHLADKTWMVSGRYTLLDMAAWGWARAVPFALGAEAWAQLPNVKRLLDAVTERPAAQRAAALKDRHAFKAEMDDAARSAMFPQNDRLKG